MPELPEVETVARALQSHLMHCRIENLIFHRKDLRYPIPIERVRAVLLNQKIESVFRRSKYILLTTKNGCGLFHLGMTGRFIWQTSALIQQPHTHFVMQVSGKKNAPQYLHYIDPRRFGDIDAHAGGQWHTHPKLQKLGVEPLSTPQLPQHLFSKARGRAIPIKNFLMSSDILVGVGNIYANESLFYSGIHPETPAQQLSLPQFEHLCLHVIRVLERAIEAGGTTIKDFKNLSDGIGYFVNQLAVYGRTSQPCLVCSSTIMQIKQSGRSTWFCPTCQKM